MKHWRLPLIVVLGVALAAGAFAYRQQSLPRLKAQTERGLAQQKEQTLLAGLEAAVEAAPADPAVRWKLADAYQKATRMEDAERQLAQIIVLSPKDRDAHLALGNARLALQAFKSAEAQYRETVRAWPKEAEAWQGLASALYHQQRYYEAMEAARKAVALLPKDPANHYVLGRSALEYSLQFPVPGDHPRELHEARREFETTLKSWPENSEVHYRLGRVFVALRRGPQAVKSIRKALELDPNRQVIAQDLVQTHLSAGEHGEARGVAEDAIKKWPESATLQDLYGQILQAAGDADGQSKAFAAFQEAARLEPENVLFQDHLGTAALRSNQIDVAVQAFEKSVQLNSNRSFPYQQLAALYTRKGNPEKASRAARMSTYMVANEQQLKEIQALSKLSPENVPLRLILGDRYRDLRYVGAARDEYLAVLSLEPANKRAKAGLTTLAKLQPAGT